MEGNSAKSKVHRSACVSLLAVASNNQHAPTLRLILSELCHNQLSHFKAIECYTLAVNPKCCCSARTTRQPSQLLQDYGNDNYSGIEHANVISWGRNLHGVRREVGPQGSTFFSSNVPSYCVELTSFFYFPILPGPELMAVSFLAGMNQQRMTHNGLK